MFKIPFILKMKFKHFIKIFERVYVWIRSPDSVLDRIRSDLIGQIRIRSNTDRTCITGLMAGLLLQNKACGK
jgi:hypothetical protein